VDDSPLDAEQNVEHAQIARWRPKRDLERTCRLYFIEAIGTDLIKIGYALNVDTRLRSLLTASAVPLKLLGTMQGGPILESRLHIQLAEHRSHGEWFRRCRALDDLVSLADKPKDAPEWLAKTRGAQLAAYLREMQAGRVVRPTRGHTSPLKRKTHDRYGNPIVR
jgi:hypothetical protein